MPQITLKKLAELSGLSIRTVNRVLKNQANVAAPKRELVLKLAAEYHYVPNMAARNLRLKRKNFVGILCGDFWREAVVQKLNDLERRLVEAGYYPVLGRVTRNSAEELTAILDAWAGAVDYVVVLSLPDVANWAGAGEKRPFPVRFIFADCDGGAGAHSIQEDRAAGVCEAICGLLARGYRRIMYCGGLPSRVAGIERAFRSNGDCGAELLRRESPGEFADGYAAGEAVMSSGAEAVFFDTDRMAAGFYRYALERGVRIPEEIAVAGFDDDAVSRQLTPELSTVAHPVDAMNSLILEIIETNPETPVRRTLPMRFMPRASIKRS